MNRVLDQAKQYISLGWEVLPIHKPLDGKCSCGKAACSSSGKHPACAHGFKDASKELKTCTSWFEKDNRNIGIKTGKETGLFVLDIDPRNGGFQSLDALEEQHGRLPETLVAETGGGGLHYYFKYPEGKDIKSRSNVYPGIDIKADGGYVVAEPSIHSSGQPYAFRDAEEVSLDQLMHAPEWLLDLIENVELISKSINNTSSPKSIGEGKRHMFLLSLGGKLRRCGLDFETLKITLEKVNELKCTPPLEGSEVASISKGLMKYRSSNEETIKPKLSEKALAGPIGSIIKKLEGKTEAHPAALLAQLLCAYGNALGVNPHFKVGPSEHRCGIYMCVVGSTAKARKGLSWGIVKHLMSGIDEDWTQENIQSGLSSSEGLIFKLSNQIENSNDPRMLVIETEFASVLLQSKRNGNTLSSTLRDAWDGAKLQTLTKSDPILAEGYHFSIVSHITKVELDKLMSEEDKYNGLANRFLWVFAERTILISNPDTIDLVEYSNEIQALKMSIKKFYKKTDILFSEEAIKVWDRMYHELSSTGNVLVDTVNSRDESYLRRIAMIYAIADDSITIKTKHLESALAFIEYAKASTNYIFGGSVLSIKEQKLLTAIKNNQDGYSRTQAFKLFNNHVKADGLNKLLSKLEEMNLIYSKASKDDDSNVLYYAN